MDKPSHSAVALAIYRTHGEIRSLMKCGPGAAWAVMYQSSLESLIRMGVQPTELQDQAFRAWKELLEAGEL